MEDKALLIAIKTISSQIERLAESIENHHISSVCQDQYTADCSALQGKQEALENLNKTLLKLLNKTEE